MFTIATDPETLNSWTPEGVHVESAGPGALHAWVESGSDVYDETGYVEVDHDQMRMEWGGNDELYTGWLLVEPNNHTENAGSVATLHLIFEGNQSETLDGEMTAQADLRVDEALDRLATLVTSQSEE